jgi:hypothetical protein
LDQLAEAVAAMADLAGDLVENRRRGDWAAREASRLAPGERAFREARRAIFAASVVGSSRRLLGLLESERRALRAMSKVATRLSLCATQRPGAEVRRAADTTLALSAVVGELRAAIRCVAASGHRPQALRRCSEVRRLSEVACYLAKPLGIASSAADNEALFRGLAWQDAFVAMVQASRSCVDAAALIEVVIAEA